MSRGTAQTQHSTSSKVFVADPKRMSAPLVGKRVVVNGLSSKPELNGRGGTAISFDDGKGRYSVRLDSGETLALKPNNLQQQGDGGAGGGGGGAGMGGMPDFSSMFGGAGGMPQMPAGMPPLPTGTALHVIVGVPLLCKIGLGLSVMSSAIVALILYQLWSICGNSFAAAGGGVAGIKASYSSVIATLRSNLEATMGRAISNTQATALLVLCACLLVYCLLPGKPLVSGMSNSAEATLLDPYQQGYEDALAGRPRAYGEGAWAHCSAPGGAASTGGDTGGGGWGMSKLLYLGIMGQRIFQMGGSPWSPQNVVQNIQANPVQGLMIAFFIYNLLG